MVLCLFGCFGIKNGVEIVVYIGIYMDRLLMMFEFGEYGFIK